MMTKDELRALLADRAKQARDALALIEKRPHSHQMFNLTLRMAAKEILECVFLLENALDHGETDEEGIKATLMERYLEFLRCRSRIQADFHEEDTGHD